MKTYTSQFVFDADWPTVSRAVLQKYPNSKNDRVLSVDYLTSPSVKNGKLFLFRLMGTRWNVPGWVLRFAGINQDAMVKEMFSVCPRSRALVQVSENISFSSLIEIRETLIYREKAEDSTKTVLDQTFSVKLPEVPGGVTSYFENMILEFNQRSLSKGRQGLIEVIKAL